MSGVVKQLPVSSECTNTSTLKAHLSHFLRLVRGGGEVVVTDRDTPIARIIPFSHIDAQQLANSKKTLTISSPEAGAPSPGNLKVRGITCRGTQSTADLRRDRSER